MVTSIHRMYQMMIFLFEIRSACVIGWVSLPNINAPVYLFQVFVLQNTHYTSCLVGQLTVLDIMQMMEGTNVCVSPNQLTTGCAPTTVILFYFFFMHRWFPQHLVTKESASWPTWPYLFTLSLNFRENVFYLFYYYYCYKQCFIIITIIMVITRIIVKEIIAFLQKFTELCKQRWSRICLLFNSWWLRLYGTHMYTCIPLSIGYNS